MWAENIKIDHKEVGHEMEAEFLGPRIRSSGGV
jgi:hypothetical protein